MERRIQHGIENIEEEVDGNEMEEAIQPTMKVNRMDEWMNGHWISYASNVT